MIDPEIVDEWLRAHPPEFGTCTSCGTERPLSELRRPLSPSFVRLTHLWECTDGEACYQAILQRPLKQASARDLDPSDYAGLFDYSDDEQETARP